MKKNKNNFKKRIASLKRAKKRGNRLKSTQKDKTQRKKLLANTKKKAKINFENQMKDLFGRQ